MISGCAQFPKVDRPTAKSFLQESALEPEIIRGGAATGSLSSHAAVGQIVRRRTFQDTLRRSGGKYPPISALDDPPGMALGFARGHDEGLVYIEVDACASESRFAPARQNQLNAEISGECQAVTRKGYSWWAWWLPFFNLPETDKTMFPLLSLITILSESAFPGSPASTNTNWADAPCTPL